jgi:hypothetical protein
MEELNTKRENATLNLTKILAMKKVFARMVTKHLTHSAICHKVLGEKIDRGSAAPRTPQILFHVTSSFSSPEDSRFETVEEIRRVTTTVLNTLEESDFCK